MYDGFIDSLTKRINESFSEIESGHNFDLGPENEIALCKFLRQALPSRYGVARGYATTRQGKREGDDVIIYEQSTMPTMTSRGDESFGRKEKIPIEAIYGYIETKNTIYTINSGDQSLFRALSQIKR